MCVLSIKVPIRKKSGNLFNDPHMSYDQGSSRHDRYLQWLAALLQLGHWHVLHCFPPLSITSLLFFYKRQILWVALGDIRRAWHLTIYCGLSLLWPGQKCPELPNTASCYQNIAKFLTHSSLIRVFFNNNWNKIKSHHCY